MFLYSTLYYFLLVFLFNDCLATFPFEGTTVLVDNLVDSYAYPLNCTTYGQLSKCNFRSATWACQSVNGTCNILLPPDESIFLIQDGSYGETYDPDLPLNVSIVYRNANTYAQEQVGARCCYSCIIEGVDKYAPCSVVWIAPGEPPHLAPTPAPTALYTVNEGKTWGNIELRSSSYSAFCRCARTSGRGVSICNDGTGCGNPEDVCSTSSQETSCKPYLLTGNTYTYQECFDQCKRIGMVMPSNQGELNNAKSTGCCTNGAHMWVDFTGTTVRNGNSWSNFVYR